MNITVKLFAMLAKYLPNGSRSKTAMISLPDGATVADLCAKLGIPDGMSHLVLMNGQQSGKNTPLEEGATVSIFPPIAGG